MAVLFVLLVAAALLPILAFCKTTKDCAEQERESPCETCLRWYECNGIDDDCPLLRNDTKTN